MFIVSFTQSDIMMHVKDNRSPPPGTTWQVQGISYLLQTCLEMMAIELPLKCISPSPLNPHLDIMMLLKQPRTNFKNNLDGRMILQHIVGSINCLIHYLVAPSHYSHTFILISCFLHSPPYLSTMARGSGAHGRYASSCIIHHNVNPNPSLTRVEHVTREAA